MRKLVLSPMTFLGKCSKKVKYFCFYKIKAFCLYVSLMKLEALYSYETSWNILSRMNKETKSKDHLSCFPNSRISNCCHHHRLHHHHLCLMSVFHASMVSKSPKVTICQRHHEGFSVLIFQELVLFTLQNCKQSLLMLCVIWYHLYNFKDVKAPMEECYFQ